MRTLITEGWWLGMRRLAPAGRRGRELLVTWHDGMGTANVRFALRREQYQGCKPRGAWWTVAGR